MEEIRVENWNELLDQLYAHAWRSDISRFRSPYAFRGLQEDKRLETTLSRLGGEFARMERHLLRNFRKYACRNEVESDSVWNWLALAKHHGLPTRLLDWSFSPFVALHFATQDITRFEQDGAVWTVNYAQVHEHLPIGLKNELRAEGSDVFTVDMLTKAAASLQDFDKLSKTDFMLFFEPPSMDDRIVNQYALFSLISNPTTQTDDWLSDHPNLYRKIILPAGLKWEVRDKLDQANITERVLFPGLDGLSAWLKRQYSPRL